MTKRFVNGVVMLRRIALDRMPQRASSPRIMLVDMPLTAPKFSGKVEYDLSDPLVIIHWFIGC